MLAHTLRGPHNLYRRYQAFLESTVTAGGLAVVTVFALAAVPVYPYNWVLVTGAAVALLGVRWPLAAYFLAAGAMVYPLYTINLYLAVLFVAGAVLGHRLLTHYLGATVLVLATPAMGQYHLHWLTPVLAGLWWGPTGAIVAGMAALWGKLLGSMAGMNPDWIILAGNLPQAQDIIHRFQAANSLDTLLLLVEPFADTPNVILYNLLQVIGWTTAGGFVGALAKRRWVKYRTPWSILVVTAGGGVIMMATHLGLPLWLNDAVSEPARLALQDRTGPLFSLLMVIIVGTTVYSLRESLDLPVAPQRNIYTTGRKYKAGEPPVTRLLRRRPGRATVSNRVGGNNGRQPTQQFPYADLPEWEPPRDESGLIMLEID